MLIIGVLCGLVTAACQALAYVFTRRFVIARHQSVLRLLVMGHLMMGLAAAAALPFLAGGDLPPLGRYAGDLVGAAGFYYIGQVGLFIALRRTDASRVAPLLGLKVVFVALIAVAVLGRRLEPLQWGAVGVAAAAAFVLNTAGGRLPIRTVLAVVITCILYALSDIFIVRLIEHMRTDSLGEVRGPLAAGLVCYVLCGIVSAVLLPWFGSRRPGDWRAAAPYASFWLTAILFMFICYAYAGVVLGVIVVSTRGLMSIALGVLVARAGLLHLEQHVTRAVLGRRIAAAAMMILAIGLYLAAAA